MTAPGLPTLDSIREAQEMLRQYLPVTRLVPAPSLSTDTRKVYLKLETEMPTGTFKVRGAIWALSPNLRGKGLREVVTASTGNHGASVAYAGRLLGVTATIFLPRNPNQQKRKIIASLGANIVEEGRDLTEAITKAAEYAERSGAFVLNDAADSELPAGPATIACEILEQLPNVDAIYVPAGDTALIRGIGSAVRQLSPRVKVVGVQAANAPSYYLSWKEGRPVPTDSCDTIADGLATRTPVPANVSAIREVVSGMRLVSEEEMLRAIRHLLLNEHIIAEPAGAASTAALLQEPPAAGNVVLVVSGANISADVLRRAASL